MTSSTSSAASAPSLFLLLLVLFSPLHLSSAARLSPLSGLGGSVDLDHPLVQDGGADDVHEATHANDIALLAAGLPAPLGLSRGSSPASFLTSSSSLLTEERLSELFEAFAHGFNREYVDEYGFNSDARARAYEAFRDNALLVHAHNAAKDTAGHTYTLALNRFADVSWEDFASSFLGASQNCSATTTDDADDTNTPFANKLKPPVRRDWRADGGVSPVKNQGHCGSCWTFSTTGALESALLIKHGKNVSLSEQQLVDCAQDYDNHGCFGGLPSHAFEYIRFTGGLDTESSYPYVAGDNATQHDSCLFQRDDVAVRVAAVHNITQGHEEGILRAVGFHGPVSVAFEVVKDLRFYHEGVYKSGECRKGPDTVNHAVLAVGYDTARAGNGSNNMRKREVPYWIIKNSWSAQWGNDGYFLMERGVDMCGIAACASYPVIE
eukprot:jgi/Chlat1/1140/Chrsp112S01619